MIQSFNPSKKIAIALRDINPKPALQKISQMMGSTEKRRESALNMAALGKAINTPKTSRPKSFEDKIINCIIKTTPN
jgi:hypothetical protein